MIYEEKGNLLDSHCTYICHQVNCRGVMKSGVAKAIREKWPIVYEKYQDLYLNTVHWVARFHVDNQDNDTPLLGDIQEVEINENQSVINMFAQDGYGYDWKRYTSYDAFWMCLGKIKDLVPIGESIAFPDHIGCCRGGANWAVIKTMIIEVLGKDYNVWFYKLED